MLVWYSVCVSACVICVCVCIFRVRMLKPFSMMTSGEKKPNAEEFSHSRTYVSDENEADENRYKNNKRCVSLLRNQSMELIL